MLLHPSDSGFALVCVGDKHTHSQTWHCKEQHIPGVPERGWENRWDRGMEEEEEWEKTRGEGVGGERERLGRCGKGERCWDSPKQTPSLHTCALGLRPSLARRSRSRRCPGNCHQVTGGETVQRFFAACQAQHQHVPIIITSIIMFPIFRAGLNVSLVIKPPPTHPPHTLTHTIPFTTTHIQRQLVSRASPSSQQTPGVKSSPHPKFKQNPCWPKDAKAPVPGTQLPQIC